MDGDNCANCEMIKDLANNKAAGQEISQVSLLDHVLFFFFVFKVTLMHKVGVCYLHLLWV